MTVRIEGAAMPPDSNCLREVRLFAYAVRDASETDTDLRDGNHCREIVKRLCGDGITAAMPPRDAWTLWRVYIRVSKSRRGRAVYSCDYRKFIGCPFPCAAEMMDVYHEIKRVLRNAREELEQAKESAR